MTKLIKDKDKNKESQNNTRFYVDRGILDEFLAIRAKNIPAGAKLVILFLLNLLGGKEYCWPALDYIAKKYGYSVKQIENHLSKLKRMGYITWDKGGVFKGHHNEDKMTRSNKYHLGYFLYEEDIDEHNAKKAKRRNDMKIKHEF